MVSSRTLDDTMTIATNTGAAAALVAPRIGQFVNRMVLVSIPALYGDGVCRPYTLVGYEAQGLWLRAEELTRRLVADDTPDVSDTVPVVFVPFAQIAAVMIPLPPPGSQPPGPPGSGKRGSRARPRNTANQPAGKPAASRSAAAKKSATGAKKPAAKPRSSANSRAVAKSPRRRPKAS
jgi:hypothetical protein